ncbi:MAG: flagellar basal body L-ring protein FlgH [Gemmatimonadaceae bacterium]
MRAPTRGNIAELATAAAIALAAAAMISMPLHAQAPAANRPGGAAPAGAAAAPATAAAQTAAPSMGRQSFYADRRDFAVGDIVTILIDDYTITTAIKENVSSDTRSRGLSLSAKLPTSSKSVGLDTRNDASQNEKGSAKRENRFQNEMSVRIVAVDKNGMLQLKGTKNINVDKNIQDITLTGWVRPQDISAQNSIESARMADASIGYTSPGNLTKPKQGIVSKILGAFWP